jgi:hypothetical protein
VAEGVDFRRETLAFTRQLLGVGLLRLGRGGEAAAEVRQSAELYEKLAGAGSHDARARLPDVRRQLAQALRAAGDSGASAAENAAAAEEQRQVIVRLVREIETLSGRDLSPEQYFTGFLSRLRRNLLRLRPLLLVGATGLEPVTPSLSSEGSSDASESFKGLVASDQSVCTPVCTNETKTEQADPVAALAAALLGLSPADHARLAAMLVAGGKTEEQKGR